MREFLKKNPWLGWVLCVVLLGISAWRWFGGTETSPFSPERMQETVTIKYTDTGDTAEMPRGRFEKMLRDAGTKLDPNQGLINPKTGKPTGFLFNQKEWEDAVARVNEAVDRARAKLPDSVRKTIKDKPAALPEGPDPAASGTDSGNVPSPADGAPKNPT
jgi:hypothetical protein